MALLAAFCWLLPNRAAAQDVPRPVIAFDRSLLRSMLRAADSLYSARAFGAAESAYTAVVAADSMAEAGHAGLAEVIMFGSESRRGRAEALREFETAIRLAPENALLHCRYGVALLPWRRPDENGDSAAALLSRAIVELQRSLALDPRRGEPHLGLYLAYLAEDRRVEAGAQLQELHTKRFFPAPVLDFARDLLITVDSGGFLILNGDLDSYPTLMLQAVERLRTDVTIVNLSLLNAPWYVRYLVRERGARITIPDHALDTLRSAYSVRRRQVVSPGVQVLDNALDNRDPASRPFYFANTASREAMAPYKRDLSLEGFAYRVTTDREQLPVNRGKCFENLMRRYRIPDFAAGRNWKDNSSLLTRDFTILADNCAAAYLGLAERMRLDRDRAAAIAMCERAGSILVAARRWAALRSLLDYWLKLSPGDENALKLKEAHSDRHP